MEPVSRLRTGRRMPLVISTTIFLLFCEDDYPDHFIF